MPGSKTAKPTQHKRGNGSPMVFLIKTAVPWPSLFLVLHIAISEGLFSVSLVVADLSLVPLQPTTSARSKMSDYVKPDDLGDYVDNSDDEIDIEDESEDPQQYLSGYYYPVFIGDVLNQRYQVVHKLGRGGFSTVWLAYDRESGKDVALKILASAALVSAAKEYEIHLTLSQRLQDHSRLILCQDHFVLSRVDAEDDTKHDHHVLVLPLQGPNIMTLQQDLKGPLPSHKEVAKQLLQAIASLHKASFVHRGMQRFYPNPICKDSVLNKLIERLSDIVLPNIVCGIDKDLGELSITERYNILGRPRKARAISERGGVTRLIGELVVPATFPSEILSSDTYYLCDFGISIEAGSSVQNKLSSPPSYCAPELFHDYEPSLASDMWSYMVCFIYIYTLYPIFGGPGFAGKLDAIMEYIGQFPLEWKGRYIGDPVGERDDWYGTSQHSPDKLLRTFLDQHRPDISEIEKGLVLSIISQVFRVEPEARITASELLENEDFKALMNLHGV